MKKKSHILKPGCLRLDTFLSEKFIGNLSILITLILIKFENIFLITKNQLRLLQYCNISYTTSTILNSNILKLGISTHLSFLRILINTSSL